jgi:hypothetical protein
MRQMDVWLRWSASVSPASASWSAASATDGKESSVGNRGNVCFLLTTTYHGCPTCFRLCFLRHNHARQARQIVDDGR